MKRPLLCMLALSACQPEPPPGVVEDEPLTIGELWSDPDASGDLTTELVLTSTYSAATGLVFAQRPDGGPNTAVTLEFPARPTGEPLFAGALYEVEASAVSGVPPRLTIAALRPRGTHPVVVTDWQPDGLAGHPVRIQTRVETPLDPLGHAGLDHEELDLGDQFEAATIGYGSEGALVGIAFEGRLHPRTARDQEAMGPASEPIEVDRFTDLSALPEGSWVAFTASTSTPPSTDGRYAMLQDDHGDGIWLDREGFTPAHELPRGTTARWTGELRHSPTTTLRSWEPPVEVGAVTPVLSEAHQAGQLVLLAVEEAGPSDVRGLRTTTTGERLSPRFQSLEDLRVPAVLQCAIYADEDGLVYAPVP